MATQGNTEKQELYGTEWLQSRAGEHFCIRVPATATNGAYSVTEVIASPGDSTPVHIHQNEDEYIHVLEGTVRVLYGEKTFEASPGSIVSLDRGVAHAWGNDTDASVRMIITLTPGGCEEALRQIALAGEDVDILAVASRFAVSLAGPPILG
jgi:quercetin dioxygenase-like cupin family protein